MGEKISWMLNVQVQGGPKISASDTIVVDAYDKIEFSLANDGVEKTVEIQPSSSGGQVQFILICSDHYDDSIVYTIKDSSAAVINTIKLDSLQLLMGDGAVGLLDTNPTDTTSKTPPTSLYFTNTSTHPGASIQILVGRKAIA
jgi:hypothetical protein